MAPAVAALPDAIQYRNRVELGDVAQVQRWLDEGLPPDFMADRIGTGLMLAAWEGNLPMMELLVSRGADVNKTNEVGEQALLIAAWRGRLDVVKWLLAHGAQLNRGPLAWTALHYAVFAGQSEVAQYLIDQGADINARSTNGSSVLMMAAYEGHEELARKLVSLGADPAAKNERGDGALEWAMKYQHPGIARLVSDRQQFIAAANRPKADWGQPVRSVPAPAPQPVAAAPAEAPRPSLSVEAPEIQQLLNARSVLAAKGMNNAVRNVDRQIAALRARRVTDRRPATVLEITAARNAPRAQKARLVAERKRPQ